MCLRPAPRRESSLLRRTESSRRSGSTRTVCSGVRPRSGGLLLAPGIVAAMTGPRTDAFELLGAREFDLLVIGGGIVGAGLAEAATAHGLSVALVDKGDFAGA